MPATAETRTAASCCETPLDPGRRPARATGSSTDTLAALLDADHRLRVTHRRCAADTPAWFHGPFKLARDNHSAAEAVDDLDCDVLSGVRTTANNAR